MAEALICPYCGSEMLVEKKSESSSPSPETNQTSPTSSIGHNYLTESVKKKRSNSVTILVNEPTDDEETIQPGSFKSGAMFSPDIMSPRSRSPGNDLDDPGFEREDSSEETLFTVHNVDEAVGILKQCQVERKGDGENWNSNDFRSVDARLRMHIDMNVLKENNEQFELIAKVGVLDMKSHSPFEATVVVSSANMIICQVHGDLSGEPSSWMDVQETVALRNINLVHQVCEQECLRLGLTDGSFWLLLFRDKTRTVLFSQQFEEVLATSKVPFYVRETSDLSALESWLSNTPFEGDEGDLSLNIALRTMCLLGKSPVTILCTESHLIITMDDYQQLLRGGTSTVTLVDAKPISAVSVLIASRSSPTNVGIKFFDEVPDSIHQWDLHFETVEGLESLVQALRQPWENVVFHVPLNVEVHP